MRRTKLARAAALMSPLLILPILRGAESNPSFAKLVLERLAIEGPPKSPSALQFLRSDLKGRLYLLHGDSLQIDEIQPSGKIVTRSKPTNDQVGNIKPISDALVSPDGSAWLLASGPERIALLTSDGLRDLPPVHWVISSLAYSVDGPIVAVSPLRVGAEDAGSPPTKADWNHPPLLLRLQDQEWQTLVPGEPFVSRDRRPLRLQEIMAERDTRLAVGAKGTLWVGNKSAYLLKHYSSSGALLESLAVGGGRVQWRERTAEDWKSLGDAARSGGVAFNRSSLANVQAVKVVRGLTARDDQVYLAIDSSTGLALDRWDVKSRALDRLLLPTIPLGRVSVDLVAGRYGLYLAGPHVGDPIWHADWENIDSAKWQPVPEASFQVSSR